MPSRVSQFLFRRRLTGRKSQVTKPNKPRRDARPTSLPETANQPEPSLSGPPADTSSSTEPGVLTPPLQKRTGRIISPLELTSSDGSPLVPPSPIGTLTPPSGRSKCDSPAEYDQDLPHPSPKSATKFNIFSGQTPAQAYSTHLLVMKDLRERHRHEMETARRAFVARNQAHKLEKAKAAWRDEDRGKEVEEYTAVITAYQSENESLRGQRDELGTRVIELLGDLANSTEALRRARIECQELKDCNRVMMEGHAKTTKLAHRTQVVVESSEVGGGSRLVKKAASFGRMSFNRPRSERRASRGPEDFGDLRYSIRGKPDFTRNSMPKMPPRPHRDEGDIPFLTTKVVPLPAPYAITSTAGPRLM